MFDTIDRRGASEGRPEARVELSREAAPEPVHEAGRELDPGGGPPRGDSLSTPPDAPAASTPSCRSGSAGPPGRAGSLGGESHDLQGAVEAIGRLISAAAEREPAVREAMVAIGRWLVAIGSAPAGTAEPAAPLRDHEYRDEKELDSAAARSTGNGTAKAHGPATPAAPIVPATASLPPAPPTARLPSTGLVPLRLGDSIAEIAVRGAAHELIAATKAAESQDAAASEGVGQSAAEFDRAAGPDLEQVARHNDFKARACRWSAERRRRMLARENFDTAIKPTDARMIDEARALECFAWTLQPYASLPDDDAIERLACVHENLATAARLARDLRQSNDPSAAELREDVYQLLAEAQSALRKALVDLGEQTDRDQDEAFHWLRRRTEEDRIFVKRYMRISDPADPVEWSDLRLRLAEMEKRMRHSLDSSRARRKAMGKLKFICQQLPARSDEERPDECRKLAATVETLVAHGVNPSDRELRELVLPVFDLIDDDVARDDEQWPGFQALMRAMEHYIAQREAVEEAPRRERTPGPEVREVAELLRGRVVVLIGGERRRHAAAALEESLELAELRWIGTIDHQSIAPFEAEVARPEVALVLLPIRWINHSFEGVQEFCRRYGKPMVRLPAGYNPNRVAHEVLRQVGGSLREQLQAS